MISKLIVLPVAAGCWSSSSVLTGIVYPLVTLRASPQSRSRARPSGSLIDKDGKAVGIRLIGQPFDDPKYFWGRPSATGPMPYNGAASSARTRGRSTRRSPMREGPHQGAA